LLRHIVGVVGTRYCGDTGCDVAAVGAVLDALCILVEPQGGLQWKDLPGALRRVLGKGHDYVPKRGDVSRHVWDVIPDMADEFVTLKAENDVERFLEINREYSRRQAVKQGLWDNRELSLLRGYERDHHLLLRTLVQLIADGELTREDEVLLIGPRHVDEVVFFRRRLGLPRTIGLDLFAYGRNEILAGDMHRMPFESNRFKLVYCAGTLSYSYNARRVIEEIARVARRPAFVFIVDAAGRKAGPDALGRSDVTGIDTLIGMFYRHAFQVLARDPGRSLAPDSYDNEPCLALRLLGRWPAWPSPLMATIL
jgi:SAM-dependent methyltransferase